jgi:two-component system sensor histidine kinase MtrB
MMKGAALSLRAGYRGWLARPRSGLFSRSVLPAGPPSRLRRITDRWGRSLQIRVITATLVLSAVVVTLLGYVLMNHLVADLYADKVLTSESIAASGLQTARAEGFVHTKSDKSRAGMSSLAQQLHSTDGTPYAVEVTLRRSDQGAPVYGSGAENYFYGLPRLPAILVRKVEAEQRAGRTAPARVWASMAFGQKSVPVPGLVIGAPINSIYQLYYFFPLSAEQKSIVSMQRNLLLVGIAVVILLAAIAWLVTRWVVVPVRLAAQGARRLSTGTLTERMAVRGTDDLAALATSFNEMAASLQEKLEQLEDLSQVQRQFVSDVSHELRTPMTTIRIASDVLFAAKDEMDAAAARSAELMQSQLERFESLLTDLLEISRYDANAATLEAEPVDVCTIVRQSADVAQQLAERRGTKIEFRLPAGPCIAEVDRRRVERILRNLLLNAVEHGEIRDTVVTVALDSGAVAVSVRDYGVGLHPGEEQLVFDRFWRADPARARTSGGTGLGLAIALEDARLHGGWLEAWGEPGKGSVFRLTLPRIAGGELHGSPLPLSPQQAGIDAAELPVLARPDEMPAVGLVHDLDMAADGGPDRAGSGTVVPEPDAPVAVARGPVVPVPPGPGLAENGIAEAGITEAGPADREVAGREVAGRGGADTGVAARG